MPAASLTPLVSVVIPVRGDMTPLSRLAAQLSGVADIDVVVSSAGEPDGAQRQLRVARPDICWLDGPPGRGRQLNRGAAEARGRWLWFVHADSTLPAGWVEAFRDLDHQSGIVGGSFRFELDSEAWQARWLERGVAARVRFFDLPYGDQGIFVRRDVFTLMGGYRDWPLMEDVEFVRRLKRHGRLAHLKLRLTTSARRWETRGWLRQSAANLTTLALYGLGMSPERLARRYDRPTRSSRDTTPC